MHIRFHTLLNETWRLGYNIYQCITGHPKLISQKTHFSELGMNWPGYTYARVDCLSTSERNSPVNNTTRGSTRQGIRSEPQISLWMQHYKPALKTQFDAFSYVQSLQNFDQIGRHAHGRHVPTGTVHV